MPDIVTSPAGLGLVALLAYVLGSVPFGIVMARLFGLGDLRAIGSGNIGATNVLRTGNKLAAFLTLILDAGKGAIAVLAARYVLAEDAAQLAGLMAFVGHCFPIFLGFRGGKGVATFLGTVLAVAWPVGIGACAIWLIGALVTRISSVGALSAAALVPGVAVVLGRADVAILTILLGALIYARHMPNIRRVMDGTEPKIGKK
ncbi:glycerol-3-phosphate 1-O-acyltransferase PlsY [Aliiroseovarius sp. PTFE2010]|uniref:glycerol-3-phosphate 1-O-acyltransferase PlsY n=1 Tax=Aliiroseovarius sp. PTFE2010 TaxID=3417190 RepID=UPI003CE7E80F